MDVASLCWKCKMKGNCITFFSIRGGLGLKISVGLKFLSITEKKIIHRDISVKQQIIYEITTNTTCILKKNNNNKPINHKISIQKRKPTNYI